MLKLVSSKKMTINEPACGRQAACDLLKIIYSYT